MAESELTIEISIVNLDPKFDRNLIRFAILSNAENDLVTVNELLDRIIFLHQVQPGGASKSYGIEAGRLA